MRISLPCFSLRLSRNFFVGSSRMGCCDLQAELGCFLSEELDLLLAVSLLIVFRTFVDVMLTILEHSIDQSGEPMGHCGDGFRSAKLAAQASVLRTEVRPASQ